MFRCAPWLSLLLFACSSTSPPAQAAGEACGGTDTCPGGFACHDHGEGYRCYAADEPSATDRGDGGRDPMRDPNAAGAPGGPPGSAGMTDPATPPSGLDAAVPGMSGQDAAIEPTTPSGCRAASITFVIDGSGSMCEIFDDSTRWAAMRAALLDAQDGLLFKLQSRAELGVDVFDGTNDPFLALSATGGSPSPACAGMYLESTSTGECPRLIEVLPALDSAAAIEAALPTHELGGSTPTDKAINVVVDRVTRGPLGPTPGLTHAIVLITDGIPNDLCVGGVGGDGGPQKSALIAAVDRAAMSGVATHVVNLAGGDVALDLFTTELAQHGAPSDPDASAYKPTDANTLRGALEEIAAEVLGCPL